MLLRHRADYEQPQCYPYTRRNRILRPPCTRKTEIFGWYGPGSDLKHAKNDRKRSLTGPCGHFYCFFCVDWHVPGHNDRFTDKTQVWRGPDGGLGRLLRILCARKTPPAAIYGQKPQCEVLIFLKLMYMN